MSKQKIKVKGDDLKTKNIVSYGVGHFMNDLCASCWFYFLSYYMIEILKIGETNAGYVMLSGQLADAIATPLVGILSDKTKTRLGKRTPWYIGGSVLVVASFILIFVKVIPDDTSDMWMLVYYLTFPALFNIGWASVQVSHMALCPGLSLNKKNKELMVRIRTGFTFMAQTITLIVSFLYFWLIKDKMLQYELLSTTCIGLGIITTILFLIFCKETKLTKNILQYRETMRLSLEENNMFTESLEGKETRDSGPEGPEVPDISEEPIKEVINWKYWMSKPNYYAYMMVYMFIRLSINVTCTVIPFYLEYILKYKKTENGGTPLEFSIVMLISTVGSIFNSLVIQYFIEKAIQSHNKRKILMAISAVTVVLGCVPMMFLNEDNRWPIYGMAFIFGVGFSLGLSTASSLTNDVVGSKGTKGAFVYGSFSFADKLSCGLVLAFFLPLIKTNHLVLIYTMSVLPPVSLILGLMIVYCRSESPKNAMCTKNFQRSIIENSRFTFIQND
jgi:Na+/melibiose symporter-like transporter